MRSAATINIGDAFTVNRLGFGAMRLCGPRVWGWPADRENALRVLRRGVELGVNFIDTADAYGPHVNEEQIAQALYPYPSGLAIATKGGSTRPGPGEWKRDGRPEHLRAACEGSLRRLRVERIDLYQLHAVDSLVPLEEQVGALRGLHVAGKIRCIGLSNVDLEQLQRAEQVAEIASLAEPGAAWSDLRAVMDSGWTTPGRARILDELEGASDAEDEGVEVETTPENRDATTDETADDTNASRERVSKAGEQ